MILRLANVNDINDILKIYQVVKNSKFCLWNNLYPTRDNVIEDINNDNLYILEINNEIAGAISIVTNNELDSFNCWSNSRALEFARVVIKPKYQHQGLAKYMVSYILEEIGRRGYDSVHISVAKKNIPAYKTYQKLKFKVVGETDMYGNNYYLLEKKV